MAVFVNEITNDNMSIWGPVTFDKPQLRFWQYTIVKCKFCKTIVQDWKEKFS